MVNAQLDVHTQTCVCYFYFLSPAVSLYAVSLAGGYSGVFIGSSLLFTLKQKSGCTHHSY